MYGINGTMTVLGSVTAVIISMIYGLHKLYYWIRILFYNIYLLVFKFKRYVHETNPGNIDYYLMYNSQAEIINIPANYETIQQGIDASIDGATLVVAPGNYYEHYLLTKVSYLLRNTFLILILRHYLRLISAATAVHPVIYLTY